MLIIVFIRSIHFVLHQMSVAEDMKLTMAHCKVVSQKRKYDRSEIQFPCWGISGPLYSADSDLRPGGDHTNQLSADAHESIRKKLRFGIHRLSLGCSGPSALPPLCSALCGSAAGSLQHYSCMVVVSWYLCLLPSSSRAVLVASHRECPCRRYYPSVNAMIHLS